MTLKIVENKIDWLLNLSIDMLLSMKLRHLISMHYDCPSGNSHCKKNEIINGDSKLKMELFLLFM